MSAAQSFLQALVLERDPLYCANARALNRREIQGKIDHHMAANIRSWLVETALRRHRKANV